MRAGTDRQTTFLRGVRSVELVPSTTTPGTVRVRWRVNMGIRGRSPRET